MIITSKEACPKITLGTLWHFFQAYYLGFGVIMIILGIYFLAFGGRYHQATMLMFGQFSFSAAAMILLFALIYPKNAPEYAVWLSLIGSLGLGYGVGYLVQKYARVGVLLIGAWMGALLGSLIYASIIVKIQGESTLVALWLTILICSIAVAILSQVFFDHTVIVGSAIVGSYVLVRGISVYIGGFPNEFILYQNYQNGTVVQNSKTILIYLLIMVLLAFSSILVQFRLRSKNSA